MRYLRFSLLGLLAAGTLLVGGGHDAYASTFTVDSTADAVDAIPGDGACDDGAGNCTLRAAIQEANAYAGADTITLPAGIYALSITGVPEGGAATGDLDITDDLTVTGAGADTTVIDGGGIDRVFSVTGSVAAEITGVTVQGGRTVGDGGGILNFGALTLTLVSVSGNAADDPVVWLGGSGGGIANRGTLTVGSSTVSNNTVGGEWGGGGGVYNRLGDVEMVDTTVSGNTVTGANGIGGGIRNLGGAVTLTNVTVSGNAATDAGAYGGGIGNQALALFCPPEVPCDPAVPAYLTITNTTVSDNTAGQAGGGIHNTTYSSVMAKNTIVGANPSGGDCDGVVWSQGHNLDSDGSCGFTATGDLSNVDPQMGPLEDNGGSTRTHALLAGSPAIDAGDDTCCPAADQRGIARPVDGDGNGSAACDMGAYEHCRLDADCDGFLDHIDNCPGAVNPDQEDGDGDNLGDVCDPCPGIRDCDGDWYDDYAETYIGTDPVDNCPDDQMDDAWPCDFDMSTLIDLGDLFNVLPPYFGSSPSNPDTNGDGVIDWSVRRDLAPDGFINLGDVFMVLPPTFGSSCTP